MANGLVTMEACYRHEIDSPWGMVFRVTMMDSFTVIKKDVEDNNIPVNTACGNGVMKWSVVRDYTCFLLHTQLGIRHTSEVKSYGGDYEISPTGKSGGGVTDPSSCLPW